MELKIENISKVYESRAGSVTALTPTSFTVEEGEFVCLLGPSGCGKSTLLFMLAGLEEPTEGVIKLDGERVQGPGKNLGMVFQNYTLFPWLTVKENAAFSQRLAGNRKEPPGAAGEAFDRAARVEYLLELMGLSKFKDSYPRELSGGMKQRVAIARTMVNRPKVMLMDEPFGALDSQTREEMQELLLLLTRHEKTTVIFVTHDVEEAIFLGSRVVVFSRRPGRVIADQKIPFAKSADFHIKLDPEFSKLKCDLLDLMHSQAEAAENRSVLLARLIAEQKQ